MGIFDGHTLRGPRVAPANSKTTASVTGGVCADVKSLDNYSAEYKARWGDYYVRPFVDQYRSAILEGRDGQLEEYLVFAANTSSLCVVEDSRFPIKEGTCSIPTGDQQVGTNDTESYTTPVVGTLQVTSGSNELVGIDTQFSSQLIEGASVYVGLYVFKVQSIESNTLAILETASPASFASSGVVINPISDGTSRLVLSDNGNRSIAGVTSITVVLGDDDEKTKRILLQSDGHISCPDPESGLIQINDTPYTRALLRPITGSAPAISRKRGDRVVEVEYYLSSPRFWWTRNDPELTRFHFVGKKQRWEPMKGGAPINLGRLLPGESYELKPRPQNLTTGGYLPGTAGIGSENLDQYAMIRLGSMPNANSIPLGDDPEATYRGVEVVPDAIADSGEFDFGSRSPEPAAVVGENSGKMIWNPAVINMFAGQTIWYNPKTFDKKSLGEVGRLEDAAQQPLFVSPIPGWSDHALLSIGSRRYLKIDYYGSDGELPAEETIEEGTAALSLSTGMLRLSPVDITKAVMGDVNAPNPAFDKQFSGAKIHYHGMVMNRVPQPTKSAALLGVLNNDIGGSDTFTVPDAIPEGLGVSGIMNIEDRTGAIPVTGESIGGRPGSSGLVREVRSVGDTFCFVPNHPFEQLRVVTGDSDLPKNAFSIRRGRMFISKGRPGTSKVKFGTRDKRRYDELPLYFLQADFTPASYASDARMASRKEGPYLLRGDEDLRGVIDDAYFEWDAGSLTGGLSEEPSVYTASEVAASINDVIRPLGGSCVVSNGRLVISPSNPNNGFVEILYGLNGVKDFSGTSALGFGPGWKTQAPIDPAIKGTASDPNWLVDSGHSIGMFRSPFNEDGSGSQPDFMATNRIENAVITEVQPSPFVFLQQVPLVDIAGVDDGVFFELQQGPYRKKLEVMDDIKYRFSNDQIAFLEGRTKSWAAESAVSHLPLGAQSIITETLHPALNGFLRASFGGDPFTKLQPDEDFITPQNGAMGDAVLVEEIGGLSHYGSKAFYEKDGTVLEDTDARFVAYGIEVGDRLKLSTGDAAGNYRITSVSPTEISVYPPFPAGSGSSPMSWEIYDMKTTDILDPQVVVDFVYRQFNHLPEETFSIRVLSQLGTPDQPLKAVVGKDLESGRIVKIRTGLEYGSPVLDVLWLDNEDLGVLSNGGIFIPEPDTQRFADKAFELNIGTLTISQSEGNLTFVDEFSDDPVSAECLPTGEIKFSSAILDEHSNSNVVYVEKALPSLGAGVVEVDQGSGQVYLSDSDKQTYSGDTLYWQAQMVTEDRKDVFLNPMAGAFMFKEPMLEGQIVEASYFTSDSAGNRKLDENNEPLPEVTEFLPLYVRREPCERINSQQYSFNPSQKILFKNITPLAFFGPEQANYDYENAFIDMEKGIINFYFEVPEETNITISYAVIDAFGGESAYTVSSPPVFRPPFRLEGKVSEFQLKSDRTDDLLPGSLFNLGGALFYLEAVEYNRSTDQTKVTIFPEVPGLGAGSSAPGNDALSLITADPVRLSDGGPAGFMVPLSQFLDVDNDPEYEPVSKGRTEITVVANCTKLQAGHILEIGGYPHTIVGVQLTEDGRRTKLNIAPAFAKAFVSDQHDILVSARPVYPPAPIDYIGSGPFLDDYPYEVVLWGERDAAGNEKPGRTLAEGVHYAVDQKTGAITLQKPLQKPMEATQSLYFARTRITVAKPELHRGQIVYPRFSTKYKHLTVPSQENGLADTTLLGTYTFRSPDSFYCRVVPLIDYMGEAALQMVKEAEAKNPSFGPSVGGGGGQKNHEQGRVGLSVEKSHLYDKDRAARKFLGYYNSVVVGFEQISESITGRIVGDRDGKFRFWVGQGLEFTPPGWENPVTGELVPRNLWSEAFCAFRGGSSVYVTETDWIVVPSSASVVDNQIDGDFIEGDDFAAFVDYQKKLIRNDLDDVVIVGRSRPKVLFYLSPFQHIKLKVKGRFERLADANEFSRIYPETANAFTTLYPGVASRPERGDYGEHLFTGIRKKKLRSSFFKTTGTVSNPVLGTIENLTDIFTVPRTARARIYRYSPTGFPEYDAVLGTDFLSNPRPAIIATPGLLPDFPLDDRSRPEVSKLASNSEEGVPDLVTGDWEISTPAFREGMRIQFGRPNGDIFNAGHTDGSVSIFGADKIKPVFVDKIHGGCCITFQDGDDPIRRGAALVEMDSDEGGQVIELRPGDTVMEFVGGAAEVEINDPPTAEDMQLMAEVLPNYRKGFDYAMSMRRGKYKDMTLPSFKDPTFFGLKELLGQKPIPPCQNIESRVEFRNGDVEPLEIPALKGESYNDDGDWSIPYLGATNTEVQRLQAAQKGFTAIVMADAVSVPRTSDQGWLAAYPDEILGIDGTVVDDTDAAATFASFSDFSPTDGSYNPRSGVGDLRSFDLMMVQPDPENAGLPKGCQGILEIANVINNERGNSFVEYPRFVTASQEGKEISFTVKNAAAFSDAGNGNLSGVTAEMWIYDDGSGLAGYPHRYRETTLKFDSMMPAFMVLDDGSEGGTFDPSTGDYPVGGLNDMLAYGEGEVILDILHRSADIESPLAQDGTSKVQIKIQVVTEGTSGYITDVVGGGGGNPEFVIQVSTNSGASWSESYKVLNPSEDGGLWFEQDKIVIRTNHPEDEHLDSTDGLGFEEDDAGYNPVANGYLDPLYDPESGGGFFPFALFPTQSEDSDGDEPLLPDDDPVDPGGINPDYFLDHYWTEETNADGDELFYGFRIDLNIVGGRRSYVMEDRLTFAAPFDFRCAHPRGTKHPLWELSEEVAGDIDFETTLSVERVATVVYQADGTETAKELSVNRDINGTTPFTFLDKGLGTFGVGSYESGVGTLKVPSWEGDDNTPITISNATFTTMPSSDVAEDASDYICQGAGVFSRSWRDGGTWISDATYINRIRCFETAVVGDESEFSFDPVSVQAGDIVAVTGAPEPTIADEAAGTSSALVGTYLVRHVVSPSPEVGGYDAAYKPTESAVRSVHMSAPTPSNSGWVRSYFPKIEAVEKVAANNYRIYINELITFPGHETTGAWDSSGDLYVHREDLNLLDSEDAFANKAYRLAYTQLAQETTEGHEYEGFYYFKTNLTSFKNAKGDSLTAVPGYNTKDLRMARLAEEVGKKLYGIQRLPVVVSAPGLPAAGATGHTEMQKFGAADDISLFGISALTFRSAYFINEIDKGNVEFSWVAGNLFDDAGGAGVAIHENESLPDHPGEFLENEPENLHSGVPGILDLSGVTDAQWEQLSLSATLDTAGVTSNLHALVPGSSVMTSRFDVAEGVDIPAFYADAGIFIEPSFPRPVGNLADNGAPNGDGLVMSPRVSCGPRHDGTLQINLADDAVGQRDTKTYLYSSLGGAGTPPTFDRVEFTVRRIRRWHKVLDDFSLNMSALRYCYETRHGIVGSYTLSGTFGKFSAAPEPTSGSATQLGAFDNDDVNINPGDMLQVLHPITNEVIAFGEIITIDDGNNLTLRPPGLVGAVPDGFDSFAGLPFEVYLRNAPVPHQQSNEELLELMAQSVLYSRQAEWNPAEPDSGMYPDNGGFVLWNTSRAGTWAEYVESFEDPADANYNDWAASVYEVSANIFTDTNAGEGPGQINFQSIGIQEDDILIIDPSGALTPLGHPEGTDQEYGTRPFGDTGTPNRVDDAMDAIGASPTGRPAELDDNRGYYVIREIKPDRLVVAPFEESEMIGRDADTNKVIEGGGDYEFALYPTISASAIGRDGKEGQGDLRPTAWAGTDPTSLDGVGLVDPGSFKGCPLSIAPVSWKIIRKSDFFSEASAELVLFHRERILSLMENFNEAMSGRKRGSYREFRVDRHIFDLGHPSIASEGLGVPSNRFLMDVAGIVGKSVFLNDSDCLSILDRRVHCQDLMLDEQKPPFSDYADPSIPFYTDLSNGVGRPMLIDRIDDVLNNSDRFRSLRYAWLTFRAHRIDGTIAQIDRWDRELPKRIREMERLRRMTEGTGQ